MKNQTNALHIWAYSIENKKSRNQLQMLCIFCVSAWGSDMKRVNNVYLLSQSILCVFFCCCCWRELFFISFQFCTQSATIKQFIYTCWCLLFFDILTQKSIQSRIYKMCPITKLLIQIFITFLSSYRSRTACVTCVLYVWLQTASSCVYLLISEAFECNLSTLTIK